MTPTVNPLGLILPRLIPATDPAIPLQSSTRWLVGVHRTLVIACPHLECLLPVVFGTDKPYIVQGGQTPGFSAADTLLPMAWLLETEHLAFQGSKAFDLTSGLGPLFRLMVSVRRDCTHSRRSCRN